MRTRFGGSRRAVEALSPGSLASATRKLAARFDDEHGGFGHKPKFPSTMSLDVLLRGGDEAARSRRRSTRCAPAGIWDQLGGGFHRYSTDERWLVPHFEKMLYDNALLLRLYVDGWRAFGDERYAATARDIARLRPPRDGRPGGRLLRHAGRRQRGRGGAVLRLDARRGRRSVRAATRRPRARRSACGE